MTTNQTATTKATATRLEWKRGVRTKSGSRTWESKCGRYRIHAHELCYGVKIRPVNYSAYFHPGGLSNGLWEKLSNTRHRSRQAAEAACEKHARAGK